MQSNTDPGCCSRLVLRINRPQWLPRAGLGSINQTPAGSVGNWSLPCSQLPLFLVTNTQQQEQKFQMPAQGERDSSRQGKQSQGKAGGSGPGERDGKSKEERAGTKLSCTKTENLLFPFKKKIRKKIINHWSIKLKATLKPFPPPWAEDVLPLNQIGQVGRKAFLPRQSHQRSILPGSWSSSGAAGLGNYLPQFTWDHLHLPFHLCFSPCFSRTAAAPTYSEINYSWCLSCTVPWSGKSI